MRKVILAIAVLSLLVGCSARPFSPPPVCTSGPSFILDTLGDPTALSRGLLAVNIVALKTLDNYSVREATAVLDGAEALLDAVDTNYAEVVAYVLQKTRLANDLAGAIVFMVGPSIEQLSKPVPISACDIALIRLHLAKQRTLLTLYAGG